MSCIKPRKVAFDKNGKITFSKTSYDRSRPPIEIPCGQCVQCMLTRQKEAALRCALEAAMHRHNAFITLTYSDEHLGDNILDYRDIQLFLKRFRERNSLKVKFFVTGEYGDKGGRKHWHMLLFNVDKDVDKEFIEELWPYGHVDYEDGITFKSASYVAGYASKKLVKGKKNFLHRRSNGLGATWLAQSKKKRSFTVT